MEPFSFRDGKECGLLIAAGGFEERSTTFLRRLRRGTFKFEQALLLRYESQRLDNEPNFLFSRDRLGALDSDRREPEVVSVSADTPAQSFGHIRSAINQAAARLNNRIAVIDISGMTHLWALACIHGCVTSGLRVEIVYTEARIYHPLQSEWRRLKKALLIGDEEFVFTSLQSASLKTVHIVPEFGGNFRPGRATCLIIFAGYEPNRIQGLVDDYSPGSLIVLFGRSPHPRLQWRTVLSRDLHRELFKTWYKRELEVSTVDVAEIVRTLEEEFSVVGDAYDLAIAPHCSKMQGVASYLFWHRHPEVQLVFTSPVKFDKDHYSRGAGTTFRYSIAL